jgi:uncharacterized lipoprotein YbaY
VALLLSVALLPALLLLAGCGQSPQPFIVKGVVHYSDTIRLPEDAEMTVELVDLSDMDDVSIISTETFPLPGVIPAVFRLEADANRIHEDRLYAVQARVTGSSEVLMTTTETYPVLTQGHPDSVSVEVIALAEAMDIVYSGVLDLRDGVMVFLPCSSESIHLVKADPLLHTRIQDEYEAVILEHPSGVFFRADAILEENRGPEVVEEYDSALVVSRIVELRDRRPSDCPE